MLKASPLCSLFPFYGQIQHTELSQQKITINIFSLEAEVHSLFEVHFLFECDGKAEMFLLDPSSMRLEPNEKQAGDGQTWQALQKCPGTASAHWLQFCSLHFFFSFLVETGAGAEHLDRPHFHCPVGRQTHLEHQGEPQAGDLLPVLPRGAHRAGDQPGAVFWQLLLHRSLIPQAL